MAQPLSHLLDYEKPFGIAVVTHQHLTVRKRMALVFVSLDIRYQCRLKSVRVIYKELGIYAEHPV